MIGQKKTPRGSFRSGDHDARTYPLSFKKKEKSVESDGQENADGGRDSSTLPTYQKDEKDITMGLGYKDAGFLVDPIWSLRGYLTASMTTSEEGADPVMVEMQEYMYEKAVGEMYEDDSVFRIITTKGLDGLNEDRHLYFTTVPYHPNKYDATGATLLHQMYYHHKYGMGRELVRAYPDYALEGYASRNVMKDMGVFKTIDEGKEIMPFTGQTLLHMTILHRNHDETEWLLDFFRKRSLEDLRNLLSARVTGSTFLPGNKTYYGETPLHFAVCSNDCELVNLLLSFISSLPDSRDFVFAPDSHGNNIMHLCVLQNLPEMYEHIKMRTMTMLRQVILGALHFSLSQGFHEREQFMQPSMVHQMEGGKGYLRIPSKLQFPDTDAAIVKKILEEFNQEHPDESNPTKRTSLREKFEQVLFLENLSKSFADESEQAYNPVTKDINVGLVKNLLAKSLGSQHCMLMFVDQAVLKNCYNPLNRKVDTEKLQHYVIIGLIQNIMGKSTAIYDMASKRSSQIVDLKALRSEKGKATLGIIAVIERCLFEFWLDGKNEELTGLIENWLAGRGRELNDGAVKQLFEDRLLNGLNMHGLNPLALAAVKGKKVMFELLIKESVVPRWQLGPIKSYIFDLDGLEFPVFLREHGRIDGKELYMPMVDPKVVHVKGAINWICAKDDDDLRDLISIPEINCVLTEKWERIGKPIVMRNGILSLLVTLGVTALACFAYEGGGGGGPDSSRLSKTETNLIVVLAIHFVFVALTEYDSIKEFGLDHWGYHGGIRGAAVYERVCVSAMIFLFLLTLFFRWVAYLDAVIDLPYLDAVSHESQVIGYYQASLGSCCLAHWMYMLLYVMAMDSFGPFVMKVAKILQKDIVYFLQIYAVIALGFGISISVITDKIVVDGQKMSGLEHALFCIATLVKQTFNVDTGSANPLGISSIGKSVENFYGVLVFFYSLVVNISLLNLLIAMMTHTYDDYEATASAKILAEKYNLMEGVIRKLGRDGLTKLEHKYTFAVKMNVHSTEVTGVAGKVTSSDQSDTSSNLGNGVGGESGSDEASEVITKCTRRFFEMNIEDPHWSHVKENTFGDHSKGAEEEFAKREDSSSRVSFRITQASFWVDDNDVHPYPSQIITYEDVARRIWRPIDVNLQDYCLYYLERLKEKGQRLVIQPYKRNVLLIIHPQNDFHDMMADKTNVPLDRLEHVDAKKKNVNQEFAVGDEVELRLFRDEEASKYKIVYIHSHQQSADLRDLDSDFAPTLPVTGAYEDSLRIAELIEKQWEHIDEIFVTQDSHFKNHISHRWYWRKGDGAPEELPTMDGTHPQPFTTIKYDHIRKKVWVPDFSRRSCGMMTRQEVEDERYGYSLFYTAELERQKKFEHFIWPDHCIVGSKDHDITYEERTEMKGATDLRAQDVLKEEPDPTLRLEDCFTSKGHHIIITIKQALAVWKSNWLQKERVNKRVKYVRTGTNMNTEMYSVLRAEVADSRDVLTGLNKRFLSDINSADKLFICGQALSHCVNYTLRDLFKYWTRKPGDITLLVDGTSAVGGFEAAANDFIKEMKDEGIRMHTCGAVNKMFTEMKSVHNDHGATSKVWTAPSKTLPNDPIYAGVDEIPSECSTPMEYGNRSRRESIVSAS